MTRTFNCTRAELAGTDSSFLNSFQDWNRRATRLQALQIERYGQQRAVSDIDQMSRRRVSGVAAAVDEDFPLARFQRLQHNLRVVRILVRKNGEDERLSARMDTQ